MGTLCFILILVTEIIFAALSITKYNNRKVWEKNRIFLRLIEIFIVSGIMLLPITYFKWRFALAIVFLIIRLLVALLSLIPNYGPKGRRTYSPSPTKTSASLVISGIIFMIFFAVFMLPAFIFTNYNGLPNTGEFEVKSTSAILIDQKRTDDFETDRSFREVPVHFFYPDTEKDNFPLVIFSHGAFGYYQSNFSTYTELASHGYVVVSLDHPHHSFFTTDTKGKTIIVDKNFINTVMKVSNEEVSHEESFEVTQEWLKLRTDDENFVLDTLKTAENSMKLDNAWYTDDEINIMDVLSKIDMEKIGLMGHSLGGATSAKVGRERKDIDAVIDLDGTMFGDIVAVKDGKYEYNKEPYPIPILDFTKAQDEKYKEDFKKENGYVYVNQNVLDHAKTGKKVVFSNVEHMDFTDLPLISPTIASMLGKGTVDNEEFMIKINGIVLNWFDYYLKNEGTLNIQESY